jgi:hypothetical protein
MATVSELKAKAKEMGLKGYSKLKKAELEKLVMAGKAPASPVKAKPISPVKSASPVKKAPAKKAPARPKKQGGYTIKEVKNDSELKEVVKQYIRNWVSRPAQQKAYNNKIQNTTPFTEAEIKMISIKAIKGSGRFMIKGTAFSKGDNIDARQNALDIKFQLNTIGKKAPYKIEPLFDNTTMTIYTDGHSDTEYPVFIELANAGNKDFDDKIASVEKAEKIGLSEGISFAREGDEEAFAVKRESTQAFRKQRAKENRNFERRKKK